MRADYATAVTFRPRRPHPQGHFRDRGGISWTNGTESFVGRKLLYGELSHRKGANTTNDSSSNENELIENINFDRCIETNKKNES